MTPLSWISVAFAAVLVAFFIIAFYFGGDWSPGQHGILRLLGSLCAGAAAAFFLGSLSVSGQVPATGFDVGFSAAGGFGLFLLVWWGWRHLPAGSGVSVSIPNGFSFTSAAEAIVANDRASIVFVNFSEAEKNAGVSAGLIEVKTVKRALEILGTKVIGGFPKYSVQQADSLFTLTRKHKSEA